MGHDHEGERVSRRRLIAGVSSIGLGGLLAACGATGDGPRAVTTSTGATVTPQATSATPADAASLFAGANTCALTPTDDKRYLRGAQVANADGVVRFTTIWPGWYRGRTIHIHVMVHVSDQRVLTTQLMFDEKLNSAVMARAPYAKHTGRDTFNDGDSIYRDSMLMKVTEEDDGYLGAIVLSADSDRDGA
ncbi:hypothetical protein [Nonomuraea sp. NPDC050783]|uniref:hypothetical protein n=1 Tax=Nonomuraea sp. NPDC050783 TaxID=3154634 RepID=UPI003465535D